MLWWFNKYNELIYYSFIFVFKVQAKDIKTFSDFPLSKNTLDGMLNILKNFKHISFSCITIVFQ